MRFFKASFVVIVLACLGLNLGLTLKLVDKDKNNQPTDDGVSQSLSVIQLQGYQQRTILMQRILGLEHIHGMHRNTRVQMCPGCVQGQQPNSPPSKDSLTKLEK